VPAEGGEARDESVKKLAPVVPVVKCRFVARTVPTSFLLQHTTTRPHLPHTYGRAEISTYFNLLTIH
jgi:hypothetical protein